MKQLILIAALAAFPFAVSATPGNNGGGNGGCGVGQQTNGCGQGGQGGQGGAGGHGGASNATGVGVGIGVGYGQGGAANSSAVGVGGNATGGSAAVLGSGNSNVRNDNNLYSTNQNSNTVNGRTQSSATGTGGAGGNASSGGNTIRVEGDTVTYAAQERAPVATAYAAPLTSSNGTCMGSSSGGGQGGGFGLSIGTTWTDNNCDIRYDAIALRDAGLADAAKFRLCQKAELKAAIEASGGTCDAKTTRTSAVDPKPVARVASVQPVSAVSNDVKYTDPIVRARLGLPPLK